MDSGLQDLFDEAKWQLFCLHCDTRLIFYSQMNIADTPFAGSLDLKFDRIKRKHDTTELVFYFYYKDTIQCDAATLKNYFDIDLGVAFRGSNKDSILYFVSGATITFSRGENMNLRYDNVLQPDVISFIDKNRKLLNPWFYNEAINRNIINEH